MERRDEEHQHEDDSCRDGARSYLRHEVRIEEPQVSLVDALQLVVALRRTLQQQRVTCLQTYLSWLSVDTLSLSRHGNEHHIVGSLKTILGHRCSNEVAAEGHIGSAQLSVAVYFADVVYMMIGSHKAMRTFQIENLVNLSGIDQSVAAQNELVVGHGHNDFLVEAHNLDERSTLHLLQPSLTHGESYGLVVGRNEQFNSIVAGGFERLLRRLALGDETSEHDHQYHTHEGDGKSGHQRLEEAQRVSRLLHIETCYDEVRRVAQQRTGATQRGSIAQRQQQSRGCNLESSCPNLHGIDEHRHDVHAVQHGREHAHGQHQLDDGAPIAARIA